MLLPKIALKLMQNTMLNLAREHPSISKADTSALLYPI